MQATAKASEMRPHQAQTSNRDLPPAKSPVQFALAAWISYTLLLCVGCTHVEVRKLADEGSYKDGIRFYRPTLYLVVSEDKGVTKAEFRWLPNLKEEYVARVHSGVGSANLSMTLTDGWNLTQFGEARDTKVPETITAISGLLSTAVSAAKVATGGGAPERPKRLKPGIYPVQFDPKTGLISGLGDPVI